MLCRAHRPVGPIPWFGRPSRHAEHGETARPTHQVCPLNCRAPKFIRMRVRSHPADSPAPSGCRSFSRCFAALARLHGCGLRPPRGNSRSTFDGEPKELQLDVQADDAAALIDVLGGGPAYVFGTSGGAQIGLNLAARHPKLVRAVVAHEPPSMMLLPDPSDAVADARNLHDIYRRRGCRRCECKSFSPTRPVDEQGQEGAPPEFAPTPRGPPRRLPGSAEF